MVERFEKLLLSCISSLVTLFSRLPMIKALILKVSPNLSLRPFYHLDEFERMYGSFDLTDYDNFELRGLPNESGICSGEIIKWAKDITPPPKKVLLAGENLNTAEHLRHVFPGADLYTTGLLNVDYEWNFENDPPSMGNFDLVISHAILEHLLNPHKHICDLTSITAAGGFLIVHSVCPGFPYHRFPIDACRFYPDWFEEAAKRLNLIVTKRRIKEDSTIFYMYQKCG